LIFIDFLFVKIPFDMWKYILDFKVLAFGEVNENYLKV